MSELSEAKKLVAWSRRHKDVILVRIPNRSLSVRDWRSQLAQGASPGFPDYLVIFADGRVRAWELKAAGAPPPRANQLAWISRLASFGCAAGWGTAAAAIRFLDKERKA